MGVSQDGRPLRSPTMLSLVMPRPSRRGDPCPNLLRTRHGSTAAVALAALLLAACGGSSDPAPGPCSSPAPALEPACTGASCGAVGSTTYSGSGTGVWRFRNTTSCPVTLDFRLTGMSAGKQVLLLFSNGTAIPVDTLPSPGTLASPPAPAPAALRIESLPAAGPDDTGHDRWHEGLLRENRLLGLSLRSFAGPAASADPRALTAASSAPAALNDPRDWRDNATTPAPTYATFARAICNLPGGRRAVFWVDPHAETAGSLTADDLAYFRTTVCGAAGDEANGGFARVKALLGDVWGTVGPSIAGLLISDAPGLQDVNVVFLQVPIDPAKRKTWVGYFYGINNFLQGAGPEFGSSNEALAFFIDAAQVHLRDTSRSYLGSALLHELTHMVNFYQRPVLRDVTNDTWLEETTATMVEDIVVPVATPDQTSIIPTERIRPYVGSGGGISYTGWLYPEQNSYALAGAFGAFVNRRYGTSILSGTITCATGGVACLDGLIRNAGGTGFADEFARAGASLFGLFPATAIPEGYGYPTRVTGAYTLAAIDVSAYSTVRKGTATALTLDFPGASHTYKLDTVPAGGTAYARTGMVVPVGTSVHVVVR